MADDHQHNDGSEETNTRRLASTLTLGGWARRRRIVLISPILLVMTMYLAFHRLTGVFGLPLGYLVAFAVYWVGWCGLFPLIVLGPRGVLELFARSGNAFWQLGLRTHVLLWSPLVFPFFFAFVPRFETAGPPVLLVSVGLGIIIGVTEELLVVDLMNELRS